MHQEGRCAIQPTAMSRSELSGRIGVIGLGVMGRPMARRMIEAGLPLVLYSRRADSARDLLERGGEYARSVSELASRCTTVVTMLPDTPDVEEVVLGGKGVFQSLKAGGLLIDMSTIAPATARLLARQGEELGIEVVDAPVSGGELGAINGTLSVMCGGTTNAVERAKIVFDHVAGRVVHAGGPGAGQVVKACNQIMVALSLQAMGEALVLGARAGVSPDLIVSALSGGAAQCWALEKRGGAVVSGDFTPGFRSRLHRKDLRIAMQLADELSVTLPAGSVAGQMYNAIVARGWGDLDHSAVVKVIEQLSGFELPRRSTVQSGGVAAGAKGEGE